MLLVTDSYRPTLITTWLLYCLRDKDSDVSVHYMSKVKASQQDWLARWSKWNRQYVGNIVSTVQPGFNLSKYRVVYY